jgi:mevalonate kinase
LLTSTTISVSFCIFQDLVGINHGLLQALTVSTPSLDQICNIARSLGLSAKLTGAGGGGCAFVLLPPNVVEEAVDKLKTELDRSGFSYRETDVCVPGLNVECS